MVKSQFGHCFSWEENREQAREYLYWTILNSILFGWGTVIGGRGLILALLNRVFLMSLLTTNLGTASHGERIYDREKVSIGQSTVIIWCRRGVFQCHYFWQSSWVSTNNLDNASNGMSTGNILWGTIQKHL